MSEDRVEALVQITEGGVEIYDRKEMLVLARELQRENAELRKQLEQAEAMIRISSAMLRLTEATSPASPTGTEKS